MKLILRIILSPIVFLWGVILIAALSIFPMGLLVMFSVLYFITCPFITLLNLSGANIKRIEGFPFLEDGSDMLNHFLTITVYIWGPFYIMIDYTNQQSP